MLRYVIKRVLLMIPTMIVISVIVFVIIELPPGNYFESYIAELQAQGESVDPRRSTSCASTTVSTSRWSSSICAGPAACSSAISATPSSSTCRSPRWSATACC